MSGDESPKLYSMFLKCSFKLFLKRGNVYDFPIRMYATHSEKVTFLVP